MTDVDALLAQTGRIVVVWSSIEIQLKYALAAMLGIDPERSMPLVADLPASQLLDRARIIAKAALDDAQAAEIKALCDDLDGLRLRRNATAHGTWLLAETMSGVWRIAVTGRKGYGVVVDTVKADDLRQLGDELEAAMQRTEATLKRVLGEETFVDLPPMALPALDDE